MIWKILQISDIHLGAIYSQKYLQKIVNLTQAEQPDLIVITGYLFDRIEKSKSEYVKKDADRYESTIGCLFLPGNHEFYLAKIKPLH